MDRASSLIFPGGRTLAGWWRQLSPAQPLGLWIGYGFLHRVEATVNARGERPIDSFAHLILQALALEETVAANHTPGGSLAGLQERLRLPGAVVQQILIGLRHDGLLTQPAPDRWLISPQGQSALAKRTFSVHLQKRHVFPFLERLDSVGQRVAPPHFLPIDECPGVRWPVDDSHRFETAWLQDCLDQPADWKDTHGFPRDVESLAREETPEAWRQVVIDRPERVMLALTLVDGQAAKELRGFTAKVDGWTLYDRAPALRFAGRAGELWPEIAHEPPMSLWQEAWRGWCRQKQLPTNEVEICSLNWRPPRLEVQAPPRLIQRLQASKSDLFKGEAWLLVGDGYLRTAAQLAIKQNP